MRTGFEYRLYKKVVQRRRFSPRRVILATVREFIDGVEYVFPLVSYGVDNRDVHTVILRLFDCGHIVRRRVLFESNDVILADRDFLAVREYGMIYVQLAGAVLCVDDTDFRPVAGYTVGEQKGRDCFTTTGRTRQTDPQLATLSLCLVYRDHKCQL